MAIRIPPIIIPGDSPTIPISPPIGFYVDTGEEPISDEVIARLFRDLIGDKEITLSR